jgi:hypothetical protein
MYAPQIFKTQTQMALMTEMRGRQAVTRLAVVRLQQAVVLPQQTVVLPQQTVVLPQQLRVVAAQPTHLLRPLFLA